MERLTALRAEGCGRLSAAGCVEGLCRRVLKMDGPSAQGFVSLTGPWPEGCGGGWRRRLCRRVVDGQGS